MVAHSPAAVKGDLGLGGDYELRLTLYLSGIFYESLFFRNNAPAFAPPLPPKAA